MIFDNECDAHKHVHTHISHAHTHCDTHTHTWLEAFALSVISIHCLTITCLVAYIDWLDTLCVCVCVCVYCVCMCVTYVCTLHVFSAIQEINTKNVLQSHTTTTKERQNGKHIQTHTHTNTHTHISHAHTHTYNIHHFININFQSNICTEVIVISSF